MQITGKIIKKLREDLGMSQTQLAEALGLSRSTIAMYESGTRMPKHNIMRSMSDYFQVNIDYLYGKESSNLELNKTDHPGILPAPDLSHLKTIPIYGAIACGTPIEALQEYDYLKIESLNQVDFALIAEGESMRDCGIISGSVVLCKSAEMVDNGQVAAVIIDNKATLKRFYDYGDFIILKAYNHLFEDQVYRGEEINDVRIIGKAIGCLNRIN